MYLVAEIQKEKKYKKQQKMHKFTLLEIFSFELYNFQVIKLKKLIYLQY
jgi:hypothetical protein